MSNMDVNYAKSTHIHTYNDVMPTIEADVAFGLGGFNLTNDETKLRVAKALTAIGMYDYLQTTSQFPAPSTMYPINLPLPPGLPFNWA
ncbi:hypothetical protein Tco_1421890 [Tanacetum coccineum]